VDNRIGLGGAVGRTCGANWLGPIRRWNRS